MNKKALRALLKKVKVLALDCDGVMAPLHIDTGIIMDIAHATTYNNRKFQHVIEIARFNHRDGQGIDLMKEAGIHVVVVTKQRSGYVDARCFKLGIPCVKAKDKLKGLVNWLKKNYPKVSMEEICYMGDDISDLSTLAVVGAPITVADASREAKKASIYITKKNGGDCAVREVCDVILAAKGLR